MPVENASVDPEKPVPPEWARFAVAVASYLAIRSFAASEADPVGARESAYLALLVGGVAACLAAVAPRPARELGWTAVLATTAVWIVGYGPHRGALVTLVLLAGLTLASMRAVRHGGVLASPGRSVAVALGVQLLVRGDLLLPPFLDARTLVSVLALPAVVGVSASVLTRRFDPRAVGMAAAAAAILSPGWNVTVTLALGSLAAGVLAADRRLPAFVRAAAAAALAAAPLWDAALGTLFALGALTLVVREVRLSWLLSAAGIAVLAIEPPQRLGTELLEFWSIGFVLVPAMLAAPREGRPLALRGMFLSLVAAMLGGGPEVLAGGVALAALGAPARGAVAGMQGSWGALLGLGTALMATYPWVREAPLWAFLELLGVETPLASFAAATALVVGGGLLLGLGRRGVPRPAFVVAAAATLALVRAVPETALLPISFEPVLLGADRPVWSHRFESHAISGGVIDSHLVHGSELETGTRVATVRLRDADKKLLGTWEILAGLDTAEWAAARPDISDRPGFRAPPAWLSQVAPTGDFFSRRYRARFRADGRLAAATITVRRDRDLPPDVDLTLFRVELRR